MNKSKLKINKMSIGLLGLLMIMLSIISVVGIRNKSHSNNSNVHTKTYEQVPRKFKK